MGKPDYSEPEDGRLPATLAATLEPRLQDALAHPVRREILRSLNGGRDACTPAELAVWLAPFSLSQVVYHLRVLAGSEIVGPAAGEGLFGGLPYVSGVSGESRVVAVLQATREGDRQRRELAFEEAQGAVRGSDL